MASLFPDAQRFVAAPDGRDAGGVERLRGARRVGLYFSAHWCPPCRRFTPLLAEAYAALRREHAFEVVYVPGDRHSGEFLEYLREMPWLAVDRDQPVGPRLRAAFGVQGIPRLVVVDADGNVVHRDARALVEAAAPDGFAGLWERLLAGQP